MIDLNEVTFTYPGGARIFDQFSFHIQRGASWAVLGPSGCGKTTLLYLIAGLLGPTSGRIQIDEKILDRPRPETGLILQDYGLLPWATVRENASLGQRIRQFYGPDGKHAPEQPAKREDVSFWLEKLGILEVENKYPSKLSGGQRQRTAIARTLALRPDLLLMDEPFSSLDSPTRWGLQDLTLQLWQEQHFTFLVVTHAIEEAAFLGQFILMLGKPPHSTARILENPAFGVENSRDSEPYRQLCSYLRAILEEK